MRVLGLAFAGVLALTAPIAAAHAVPLGSNLKPVKSGTAPAMVQVWGGCGWGWHPVPAHWSQWRGGWVRRLEDRRPGRVCGRHRTDLRGRPGAPPRGENRTSVGVNVGIPQVSDAI